MGGEAADDSGEDVTSAGGCHAGVTVGAGPCAEAVADDGAGAFEDDDTTEAAGERGGGVGPLRGVGGVEGDSE